MKTADGEPLSGGASAASDFADFGGAAQLAQQFAQPAVNNVPYTGINPITGQPM